MLTFVGPLFLPTYRVIKDQVHGALRHVELEKAGVKTLLSADNLVQYATSNTGMEQGEGLFDA